MTPFSKQITKTMLAEANIWQSEFPSSGKSASSVAPMHAHTKHEITSPADEAGVNAEVFCIFDAHGCARFCSAPQVFLRNSNDMRKLSLCDLVPALPFRPTTPGYNIAYVRLNFPHDAWQTHTVRTADAGLQPAELCLKPIPLGRGYCLLGRFRLKDEKVVNQHSTGTTRPQRWQNMPTAAEIKHLVASENVRHAA